MKAAAIQMVSGSDLAANLTQAAHLLEQAARAGAELAVLPEYFCLLGKRDTDKLAIQEPYGDGPIQQFLAQRARDLRLWIVGGTLPLSTNDPQRVRNTSLAFSADGNCIARYDKVHLFQYDNGTERYDEARVLEAGDAPVAFDMPARDGTVWRIAMSVCYDLRFAELYRSRHADSASRTKTADTAGMVGAPRLSTPPAPADVLLVPSAFTYTTGEAHWEVLLRARAIENLAYVLAPAQGGTHDNGRRTWGHTLAVDPWGGLLGTCAQGPGMVIADLDAQRVAQCRQQLPALAHRRL